MLEVHDSRSIFYLPQGMTEAACVTTNGIVRKDGRAVMGRGIAKEADDLFHVSERLAQLLKQYGNRAFNLGRYNRNINGSISVFTLFTFPTKHHWKDLSDITLICKSAEELVAMCDKFGITKCYLPPAGCGNGGLDWEITVRPWLSMMLDDRFVVIFNK